MPLPTDISQMTADQLDTQWKAVEQAEIDGSITLDQTAAALEIAFTDGTPVPL